MARKGKVGIDYFSHDVDMLQDKKIKIIKAKHGLLGYAIFLRLLEEVYRENGYYLQIDEDFNILFSDDNNVEYDVYILVLNDCIEKGLFNKELYEKYSILTSERIQSNYCSATERRKEIEFLQEYLLVDITSKYNIEKVNVCILCLNVDINQQSKKKVKESKVKEKESTEHIDSFFEKIWKMYPLKKGKGTIKDASKKRLFKLGEELERCIERYIKDVKNRKKDFPELKYQNGSTFFNSGYIDYLDENYQEVEEEVEEKKVYGGWDSID